MDIVTQSVLLIEDDEDARELYAEHLRAAGFDVVTATTAREALDAVSARTPDLVVLDRKLPDRDGLELATLWRAGRAMATTPIIVLTAFAGRTDVEKALEAGCDAFLAKPCPGDVLVTHVKKLLLASAPTGKLPKFRL
ncbi:MAG: response regulator receiver [Labilithrix sp.]|jgi:DNA-binding response OmpR family regulator|nr:response regulator receiver [Labilithrix sp.]